MDPRDSDPCDPLDPVGTDLDDPLHPVGTHLDNPLHPLEVLLTDAGRALVERLTPYDAGSAMARLEAVRAEPAWAGHPEVVAAAATQARLRTRASLRFPEPARWWTPEGLEQATRPMVAAQHAQRFVDAGVARVLDLGAGIGSDALALAAAGLEVVAVDRDPDALWALRSTARDRALAIDVRQGDVIALVDDLLAERLVAPGAVPGAVARA
ncbi:MAG: class I SAM-dependent methyltransferase, partial [Candidatus Nanopelagicales bacterium]